MNSEFPQSESRPGQGLCACVRACVCVLRDASALMVMCPCTEIRLDNPSLIQYKINQNASVSNCKMVQHHTKNKYNLQQIII